MRYLIILLVFLVCTAHGEDRDTMYWEEYRCTLEDMEQRGVKCEKRTIECDSPYQAFDSVVYVDYQRRPDRWTCRVDTTHAAIPENVIIAKSEMIFFYDTTWIPLAPVFIDTTLVARFLRQMSNGNKFGYTYGDFGDRDTTYWKFTSCADSTGWTRRLDRWTFTVDTTLIDTIYNLKYEPELAYDTTWIPLCPVFVDTVKRIDTQTLVYPDNIMYDMIPDLTIPDIIYPDHIITESFIDSQKIYEEMRLRILEKTAKDMWSDSISRTILDTVPPPGTWIPNKDYLRRQADKSFFEAVKQLIEEYEGQ